MEEKGKVTKEADGFKVIFERVFQHDINTVWDAITNPEKLKLWFTDFEMDFKPGGWLIIRFRDEEKTPTRGKIVSIDPPHKFVFTWEGELAEWELFKDGDKKCKLVLTYSKVSGDYAASVPAGFHTLLDQLKDMLAGVHQYYAFGTEESDPKTERLKDEYSALVYSQYPELQPIVIEKKYDASVERVWKAITDKDHMKQWYFELAEFKPKVGFEFQFKGMGQKGEKYLHLCKVTEVVKNKKLSYSWQYEGHEGISYVTFELTAEDNKTRLKLTHKGLHTFPTNNPDFSRDSFNGGWTELITTDLKNFVEGPAVK